MARLFNLVNGDHDDLSLLTEMSDLNCEALETIISMVENDELSDLDLQELQECSDFIITTLLEEECDCPGKKKK